MKKILIFIILLNGILYSKNIDLKYFFNKNKCDLILNKKQYIICYNLKIKGTKTIAYTIKENQITNNKLIEDFFIYDDEINENFQANNTFEKRYKNLRLVPYFAFNYNEDIVNKISMLSNIRPMEKNTYNLKWKKFEKYSYNKLKKYKKLNFIIGMEYKKNKKINDTYVPSSFWTIIYNNNINYKECFLFKNKKHPIIENYKLIKNKINCSELF
jgi:endonuclease G